MTPALAARDGLLLLALVLILSACSQEPETGPLPIVYGRDACDLCGMIISDPRFAAEIRGGADRKIYKFDDIGDAIHFLNGQTWKNEPGVEFWVMDVDTGKTWLDAHAAHYIEGMQSPMAHGFGAVSHPRTGTVGFEDMRTRVLARRAGNFCPTRS